MLTHQTQTAEEAIAAKLKAMPERYRARYSKAMKGKSLRMAVDSHCFECIGWCPAELEDRDCSSPSCPLYPYRPFRQWSSPATISEDSRHGHLAEQTGVSIGKE